MHFSSKELAEEYAALMTEKFKDTDMEIKSIEPTVIEIFENSDELNKETNSANKLISFLHENDMDLSDFIKNKWQNFILRC